MPLSGMRSSLSPKEAAAKHGVRVEDLDPSRGNQVPKGYQGSDYYGAKPITSTGSTSGWSPGVQTYSSSSAGSNRAGAGAGGGAGYVAPPPPNIQSQRDPTLDAVQDRYDKFLGDIEGGTGRIMDIAGSRTRDAAEGARTMARENAAARGVGSAKEVGVIDSATQRNIAAQNADIALGRESLTLQALTGAGGNAANTAGQALAEKQHGLGVYEAASRAQSSAAAAAAQSQATAFNQMMALLETQRSSPVNYPAAGGGGSVSTRPRVSSGGLGR